MSFKPPDPEIQIVNVSASFVECGFCSTNLTNLTLSAREEHYELHFSTAPVSSEPLQSAQTPHLSTPPRNAQSSKETKSHDKGKEKATITKSDRGIFWHRGLSLSPPRNYTQGLIPLLKKALWSSHAQGTTLRAVLCDERVIHISSTSLDRGWGCSYRNFQMACAALMDQKVQPKYSTLLSEPSSPGLRDIQQWIEDAWNAGFDPQGAQQLKKLIGTKKWLGTADLYVAFVYRGIPAELVDINLTGRPRGVDIVKDWIVDYFSPKSNSSKPANINDALRGASPIVVTDRMPIILQHQGHSRTIVGYEVTKTGKIKLLMFDPSMNFDNLTKQLALALYTHNTSSSDSRKRSSGSSSASRSGPKRFRAAMENVISIDDEDEAEVLIIESSPDQKPRERKTKEALGKSEVPTKTLQDFLDRLRLHTRGLGRMEYQILYFPMTQPLTEQDKRSMKMIVSTEY
ncbi:Zinc finger with UFM1-specific peptidase domain protein [Termitomyces sp. J132]|nr:hypothetical protein H2248_009649 [Termitomyces sp. 'cryptogamus']KNZ75327.1 Zinc finger with UFM1-specific peptidase domain protein [Termitomyces sp. J132]